MYINIYVHTSVICTMHSWTLSHMYLMMCSFWKPKYQKVSACKPRGGTLKMKSPCRLVTGISLHFGFIQPETPSAPYYEPTPLQHLTWNVYCTRSTLFFTHTLSTTPTTLFFRFCLSYTPSTLALESCKNTPLGVEKVTSLVPLFWESNPWVKMQTFATQN